MRNALHKPQNHKDAVKGDFLYRKKVDKYRMKKQVIIANFAFPMIK